MNACLRITPSLPQSGGGGSGETSPAGGGSAEGWDDDDDWGALEDTTPSLAPAPAAPTSTPAATSAAAAASAAAASASAADGWDGDGWGEDEFSAPSGGADGPKSAAEIRWPDAGDDPFAAVPTKRLVS